MDVENYVFIWRAINYNIESNVQENRSVNVTTEQARSYHRGQREARPKTCGPLLNFREITLYSAFSIEQIFNHKNEKLT